MEDDKKPFSAPIKGWAPRGWDDGSGIDRKMGKPLPDGYFTSSNHLSQDLADALMNVWLSTRDPEIAEALGHLRDYKRDFFQPIQGVEIAASVAEASAAGFLDLNSPDLHRRSAGACITRVFTNKRRRGSPPMTMRRRGSTTRAQRRRKFAGSFRGAWPATSSPILMGRSRRWSCIGIRPRFLLRTVAV